MPLKSLTDLANFKQESFPCQDCEEEPWQCIDHPTEANERWICLPCMLKRLNKRREVRAVHERSARRGRELDRRRKRGTQREPGWNRLEPILPVNHCSLKPMEPMEKHKLASVCPVCKKGNLLVRRNHDTLRLEEYDYCLLCGQRVQYLDIDSMRGKDWAR